MRVALAALTLALVAGCGGEPREPESEPSPTTTATPIPSAAAEPERPTVEADALPDGPRQSLPGLMRETPRGGPIRPGRQLLANDAYTRTEVTYAAGDVTVSGVLLRPRGTGPFPAVVMAHGYIDPAVYVTGQGLVREQDHLARAGYVVLHVDYRGHAASDPTTEVDRETRLGYTRDVLAAVTSVKRLRYVDPDRTALLGRSMGGGVVLNALVAQPGLVRAAVVFAPVSSDFGDNVRRWTVAERPEAARAFTRRFGDGPWPTLSSRTYADRITEPLLIHHGTEDESCPIRWSRETQRVLAGAGVDSRLRVYDGEQHAFGPQWPLSMRRTEAFLRARLG
jgi:dipeptidyl aminopeptidase/acylaminoacyl peptidase